MPILIRVLARGFHGAVRRDALSKMAMPAMSPTMTDGGIAAWKKKEGETFVTGDVLLEIETDKASIDVEAQDDGILAKIITPEGAKNIAVGTTIAIIAEDSADITGAEALAQTASRDNFRTPDSTADKGTLPSAASSQVVSSSTARQSSPVLGVTNGGRFLASPFAKYLALERGVPLGKIDGSGPGGRIVSEDVDNFIAPSFPSTDSRSTEAPICGYVDVPTTNMRRIIGARLTQAKQDIPHYYLTIDIRMNKLLKLRETFNSRLSEQGLKLSVNDFLVKASALAMEDVPEVNSRWMSELIRRYKTVDISLAVATSNGLVTPILKDTASKGLACISAETKYLAKRARDGKLTPNEYQGGTFTISNLGMHGVSHFTAIINPPQSSILAVGSIQPKVIPATGHDAVLTVIPMLKATLSSDHRIVDGAVGARWLSAFKGYLESPLTLML